MGNRIWVSWTALGMGEIFGWPTVASVLLLQHVLTANPFLSLSKPETCDFSGSLISSTTLRGTLLLRVDRYQSKCAVKFKVIQADWFMEIAVIQKDHTHSTSCTIFWSCTVRSGQQSFSQGFLPSYRPQQGSLKPRSIDTNNATHIFAEIPHMIIIQLIWHHPCEIPTVTPIPSINLEKSADHSCQSQHAQC